MDVETFRALPTHEVARIVRENGLRVCAYPAKGTRRWFMLEYPPVSKEAYAPAYLDAVFQHHIEKYKLLFDHGVTTLLTPSFDLPLMQRGDAYMRMAAKGLAALAEHPAFLEFFAAYGVRVRFYGAYRKHLMSTPYAYLLDLFETVMTQTEKYDRHRLFFGLFVHDATETVADLAVQHYREYGETPGKQALIERYYGEDVGPVDIFISFSKLRAFDMPLLMTGKTDLYFMVSPSLYLDQAQLRDILYDHLFTRRKSSQADYEALSTEDQDLMRAFYRANAGNTLGIGTWHERWQFWYPRPQVKLPPELT